jgi:hypothetical protein
MDLKAIALQEQLAVSPGLLSIKNDLPSARCVGIYKYLAQQ